MTGPLPEVGAIPLDDARTRFTVWAPRQKRMCVRFGAPDRAEPMIADDSGYHTLVTTAPPGTRYRFELADGRLRPDPASRAQPDGVHGASEVVAPDAGAATAPFDNPPIDRHVIYELHVGTFTPEGTFEAIIPRIPALRSLGVTAIELMPVASFPGARNWGYDGVSLFAAQCSYGGLAGLRRLVDASHRLGMAVILDVVYNHLGPEGNFLGDFGPYFTERYRTPWGAALNFDGPDSDHVRAFFIQNSLFWTRACAVDGLRLDAVHAIADHSARTFLEELTEHNHLEAERAGRRVLIIAESSDNDPRLLRPPSRGGVGMDGCWNDDYHHAIRTALTGDRRGYYRPFGEPAQIAKAVRDRFVFTGEYSASHRRRQGAAAPDIDHGRLVVFTQNHDQVGNRPHGDRLDASAGADAARVAAALVILSPFTPMLWMGEEYGETAPFQYFVSHSDPELIAAVRRGRAEEFAALQGAEPVPDPQDERTFLRSKLAWALRDQGDHARRLAYYAELLRLRREFDLPGRARRVDARAAGSLVSIVYGGAPRLEVMANCGEVPTTATIDGAPPGERELLLDSNDARWGGSGRGSSAGALLTIPARTVMVFRVGPGTPHTEERA